MAEWKTYDENLYYLQKLEEKIYRNILPNKKDFEAPIQQEIVKKQSSSITITSQRAQLDVSLLNILTIALCHFHYYEIPLHNHKKPLIINFTFTDQAKMKFYISRHTITPNRFNFEEAFQRKQVLKYTEPGEDPHFQSNCLYMAVFSQQQTTIHIKLQYGIKVIKPHRKEDNNELRERPVTASYFGRSSMLRPSQRQSKDMIMINMNLRQFEPETHKKQLMIRRVQSAKRFQETIQKKQQIDADKVEQVRLKYEYSIKKKIITEIMTVRNQIETDLFIQQKEWLSILTMVKLCKIIRREYCLKANELLEQANIKRRKNRTRLNLRKYLHATGNTIQKRTFVQSVMCLELYIGFTDIKVRAEKVMNQFMKSYGQIGEIIQKTYRFRRLIRQVLEQYRQYKKKVSAYVQRIVMLWNKNWGILYYEIQKEDLEKVREIKKQMSKTIVNFHFDEEIKKSPYLDNKLQWKIAQNYYLELRANFLNNLAQLRTGKGNSANAYNVILATQGFDNKNKINLFAIVNRDVLKNLCYRYMLEKKLIQSVLLKKN